MLSFKIFKKNSNTPIFEITKKDGVWVNSQDIALDTKRLEDMVDDFITLKSSFTLDSPTDAQKKQTQSLLSTPEFTLKIEKEDKEVLLYRVSTLTRSLVEVPLKDEAHFIINENHSPVIYVVKKDFSTLFELTNDMLKTFIVPTN